MKLVKWFILIALLCVVSLLTTGIATALDEWVHVDLEPFVNSKLVKHQWWTKQPGDSTLSRLPIGEVDEFEGPDGKVEFQNYRRCDCALRHQCRDMAQGGERHCRWRQGKICLFLPRDRMGTERCAKLQVRDALSHGEEGGT